MIPFSCGFEVRMSKEKKNLDPTVNLSSNYFKDIFNNILKVIIVILFYFLIS